MTKQGATFSSMEHQKLDKNLKSTKFSHRVISMVYCSMIAPCISKMKTFLRTYPVEIAQNIFIVIASPCRSTPQCESPGFPMNLTKKRSKVHHLYFDTPKRQDRIELFFGEIWRIASDNFCEHQTLMLTRCSLTKFCEHFVSVKFMCH